MKCSNHNQADAVAVCVYCVCGLCPTCHSRSGTGRAVCSVRCSQGLAATEAALEALGRRVVDSNNMAVRLLFGAGLLFIGFGVYEGKRAASNLEWFLTLFMGGAGALLIVTGLALSRAMRKKVGKDD